jgi:arginine utilization protein RocB
MNALQKMRLSFPFTRTLIIPVVNASSLASGKTGWNERDCHPYTCFKTVPEITP